jgi:uncharacterized lipoprotein NlpE involved in copper resistance
VRTLLALALCAILTSCAPGWTCLNRTIKVGTWTVTCRYVNADRSCSGVRDGADFALVMINHEAQHAREYGLLVSDRRAVADNGGNALFQVLAAAAPGAAASAALPTHSDYVSAGASKAGVLTVALRKDDVEALAGGDGFHLVYTSNGSNYPTLDITANGMADVASTLIDRMNTCLDDPG